MYSRIVVACFVLVMVLPLATTRFKPLLSAQEAARQEWARPGMDGMERWRVGFPHEFGLHETLIDSYGWMRYGLFDLSPNDKVIVGRDGWLFLGQFNGYDGLQEYLHARPFEPGELAAWVRYFEAKQALMEARHVPYVLVFAPDKPTVYPEYMPAGLHPTDQPSRVQQLCAALHRQTSIRVMDLAPALVARKGWQRLYYKTDTHWNAAGAEVAYEAVARDLGLQPMIPTQQPDAEVFTPNLSRMSGAPQLFPEDEPNPTFKIPSPAQEIQLRWNREHLPTPGEPAPVRYVPQSVVHLTHPSAPPGRVLILGDSYLGTGGFADLLAQHFRDAEYVFSHVLDPQQVQQMQPAVVVEEMVEMDLMTPVPPPLLEGNPSQRLK